MEIQFFYQSLNHVDVNMKLRFLLKSGYFIVPSASTALKKSITDLVILLQARQYIANPGFSCFAYPEEPEVP